MTHTRLDQFIHDPQRRGLRAAATVLTPADMRETTRFWPATPRAELARVTHGLADDAIARIG